jgi:hypothetical protein
MHVECVGVELVRQRIHGERELLYTSEPFVFPIKIA